MVLFCWNTRHLIECSLPSILDIFLTQCSSKAESIVEEPTHPSHSLFQLLPSGRRYRSIRARSARLLNSFFPQAVRALNSHHTAPLWNPKQPPPPPLKLLFLWQFRWAGPAQATCSNTLSSACTRHFHTPCVSIIPQRLIVIYDCNVCMFTGSCTTNHLTNCSPASCLNVSLFAHVQYLKSSAQLYSLYLFLFFFSLCIGNHFYI